MTYLPVDCPKWAAPSRARPRFVGAIRTLAVLALAAVLLAPGSAMATIGWCKSDPVVQIGANVVDIYLSAPADAPLKVTGPNQIVVTVPETVYATAISVPLGFGRGESVSIVSSKHLRADENGIDVVVQAFVPANDDTMPVVIEFAPNIVGLLGPTTAQGVANSWVTLETRL